MTQNSKFVHNLEAFRNYVYTDFLGGPKLIPMRYVINFFKGFTGLWIYFLMVHFNNYSPGMYLYLFLHGTYGLLWLIKDLTYPDASFKQKSTLGSLLILTTVLTLYWLMPVTIAAGYGIQYPSKQRTILCLVLYFTGAALMMGSDIYKTKTLQKKKGLISDGPFTRTRNPNYLGEVMIYASFAICTGHWLSYMIVVSIWCSLFVINMYLKDELSYRKKQGWQEYKKKSYIFLPKIFESDLVNIVFYAAAFMACYFAVRNCHELRLKQA